MHRRSHLDRQAPDQAYFNALAPMMVARHNRGGNPLSKTLETVQPNRTSVVTRCLPVPPIWAGGYAVRLPA
ncbi:MAG: hypothetical protein EOP20_00475 [Hyphomicrobiales bacterium]|nr:MAG: hypothetical protein EOP20_00475 [Hyphomicrobiales bacterium]